MTLLDCKHTSVYVDNYIICSMCEFLLSSTDVHLLRSWQEVQSGGQENIYKRKKSRHSVASRKGNILTRKRWLILLWALVPIATGAGSFIRLAGQKQGITGHKRGQHRACNLVATIVNLLSFTLELSSTSLSKPLYSFIHSFINKCTGKHQLACNYYNYCIFKVNKMIYHI